MAAPSDQATIDAFLDVISGVLTAGTLTNPPVPVPQGQAHIAPPVTPANDVREHDNELNAHRRIRDFTVAMNDVETAKAHTIESKRKMFIYADELLKKHTIPIVSPFNVAYVRRLWTDCGWRGHVIYPTEPADFLTQGQAHCTLEEVTDMVRRLNIFPLSTVDLGQYDRQELIATHQTLIVYGYWCAEVDRRLHDMKKQLGRHNIVKPGKSPNPIFNMSLAFGRPPANQFTAVVAAVKSHSQVVTRNRHAVPHSPPWPGFEPTHCTTHGHGDVHGPVALQIVVNVANDDVINGQ
ncbi:hypothetical protein RHSIM_Rhsim01G0071000 [Rhododendron simsii]|uniref:Uncharacterized protein n=1 Tax=Rhododendron simsii TaxID=118357 RepID=A0A834L475_RHOSS|nr:hypothetical protein RHSIM_RhsimUnG0194600 [Rhododendron simsii]KAF7153089.1 hypothetical protein RHSIM_Rhsim01G0071000 [Rhododendron simsii]